MRKLFALFILLFIGFLIYNSYQNYLAPILKEAIPTKPKKSIIQIKDTTYEVELASTDEQRAKGLSGRDSLEQNLGMLFIFPDVDYHTFWMREMKFALDFIWIKDDQIVDIAENVPPPLTVTYSPPTIKPKQPVNRVLEINAGQAKLHGFQIGDKVTISLFEEVPN